MAEIDNTIASKIKPPSTTGLKDTIDAIEKLRGMTQPRQAYQQSASAFPTATESPPAVAAARPAVAPVAMAPPVVATASPTRSSAFISGDSEPDSFARRFYFQ